MTMREILFRGKTGRLWAYGHVRKLGNKTFMYEVDGYPSVVVDPDTVGQFTGLTDKNGKKIFEGDIVKVSHTIHLPDEEQHLPRKAYGGNYTEIGEYVYFRNYAVKWNGKEGGWEIRNGSDGRRIHSNYVFYHGCEVIGNIHDHKELLHDSKV